MNGSGEGTAIQTTRAREPAGAFEMAALRRLYVEGPQTRTNDKSGVVVASLEKLSGPSQSEFGRLSGGCADASDVGSTHGIGHITSSFCASSSGQQSAPETLALKSTSDPQQRNQPTGGGNIRTRSREPAE